MHEVSRSLARAPAGRPAQPPEPRRAIVVRLWQDRCVKASSLAGLVCTALAPFWGQFVGPAPSASADPCPDVEVVFARGTAEPPGVGRIGQSLVDSLSSRLGGKSVGEYAVNYPASTDFPTAVDGISDASAHVEQMAANCPRTRMVLGGYSQGAAVVGFVTESAVPDGVQLVQALQPMPANVASHVAAVTLFGKPSPRFMGIINQPPVDIGPLYAPKTIELCVPGDPICSDGSNPLGHRQYLESGLVDQAADFAAGRLTRGS